MTRDDLYALIADHVTVTDEWGGEKIANWRYGWNLCVAGIDEAVDAILARIAEENNTGGGAVMDCPYCGQPLDDDDDDAQCDTPRGYAHEACYLEWLDDAEGRAADNAFDLAGDR